MKRLSEDDLRRSLSQKNLLSEADASHILHFSERIIVEKIGRPFFFRARIFRKGIIFFAVENSPSAEKMKNIFFEILPQVQKAFPQFDIRGMRTKIEMI